MSALELIATPAARPARHAVPAGRLGGRAARPLLVAQVLLLAAGLAYAVHSITGAGGDGPAFEDWVYDGVLVGSALLCLARAALVRADRAAWLVLGLGLLAWASGVVALTVDPGLISGAFPTPTDFLWLSFYPAAYVTLVLLVRRRVRQFYASLWLDGVVGGLAVAAVVAGLVLPALLRGSGGSTSTVLGDLAYPVADLVLLGFVAWVGALTEWRPGRVLGLVAAGLALGAAADLASLWWALSGHATEHTPLDWLWPASALTLGLAAWRRSGPVPALRLTGMRPLVPPVAFAISALALIVYGRVHPLDTTGFVLACATLTAVIVRLAATFAENLRMVAASQLEALTDPLTGLANRRRLMAELQRVLHPSAGERPHGLLMFDLDGFKRYNDTFGHLAGDALLARLGERLRAAIGQDGLACRLGGDEFCALVSLERRPLAELSAAGTEALTARGRGFTVTVSVGAALIPVEAADPASALQVADERLYRAKGSRHDRREEQGTLRVLRQILHEREPNLYEHLDGVADLTRRVGGRLGLAAEELDEMAQAAELHDIGLIAVPDSVLTKASGLSEAEREFMRQHTLVGERMLAAAPALRRIARLVRHSHEHFDGRGYPDGLTGEDIPLPARIIAVCDAYDAMTTNRPYSPSKPHREALAELRRCAGSQFDPDVVEVFCDELAGRPEPAGEPDVAPNRTLEAA